MTPSDPLERLLAAAAPFSELPAPERAALARRFQLRRFADRETIFNEGEAASSSWLVVTGRVRIVGAVGGDRLMELESLRPGELFGLFCRLGTAAQGYPCTAVADGPVHAARLPDGVFSEIYGRDAEVARRVCELSCARLRQVRGLVPFARESAERRVIESLLALARRGGPRVEATRQSLAVRVGATIETVFRVLARLRRAGLVRTERGAVVVERPQALARRLQGL